MGSGIAGRGLLRATPSKELRDRNNETLLRTVHAKDRELVLAGDRGPRRDVRQQQRAFARHSDLAHDRTGLVDERGPVEERRLAALGPEERDGEDRRRPRPMGELHASLDLVTSSAVSTVRSPTIAVPVTSSVRTAAVPSAVTAGYAKTAPSERHADHPARSSFTRACGRSPARQSQSVAPEMG